MNDRYTIEDGESKQDKWNRGLISLLSLYINPTQNFVSVHTIKSVIMN